MYLYIHRYVSTYVCMARPDPTRPGWDWYLHNYVQYLPTIPVPETVMPHDGPRPTSTTHEYDPGPRPGGAVRCSAVQYGGTQGQAYVSKSGTYLPMVGMQFSTVRAVLVYPTACMRYASGGYRGHTIPYRTVPCRPCLSSIQPEPLGVCSALPCSALL